MSMRASQNSGMEMTAKDNMFTSRSMSPRGRLAAIMPMGMPSDAMAQVTRPRSAVLGQRSKINSLAGIWWRMDMPKSPLAMSQ